jgi:c-di-GMP-binding flagellar brake protein YcgR
MRARPQTAWPQVNDRVSLRLECCAHDMAARVEDTDGNRLTLAAPLHHCETGQPGPGRRARLHWLTTHAVMELTAVLVETRGHPLPVWVVEGTGAPERVQRRRYVRVPTQPLPVLLRAGGRQVSAWLLDLSEGGLRCTCSEPVELAPGERLVAWIKLGQDGPNFALSAEVVRVTTGADQRRTIACSFVDVPTESADRLRQYVFDQQLRERRRQAGLA